MKKSVLLVLLAVVMFGGVASARCIVVPAYVPACAPAVVAAPVVVTRVVCPQPVVVQPVVCAAPVVYAQPVACACPVIVRTRILRRPVVRYTTCAWVMK